MDTQSDSGAGNGEGIQQNELDEIGDMDEYSK